MKHPIRDLREKRELSRMALALKTGIGLSTIGAIEQGRALSIAKPTLEKLSAFSGMPADVINDQYKDWRAEFLAI